jgi:hypothetical protein
MGSDRGGIPVSGRWGTWTFYAQVPVEQRGRSAITDLLHAQAVALAKEQGVRLGGGPPGNPTLDLPPTPPRGDWTRIDAHLFEVRLSYSAWITGTEAVPR